MADMKDLTLVISGTLHISDTETISEMKERLDGGWGCRIDGTTIEIFKDMT